MARNYYKAVSGITDGPSYHTEGHVFPETEELKAHFALTGGVDEASGRVLYVKSSLAEYREFNGEGEAVQHDAPANPEPVDEVEPVSDEPAETVNPDPADDSE